MAIDRDRITPIDTIQSDFRDEMAQFIDDFNALVASYVPMFFATQAQVDTGTNTTTVVSPATLAQHLNARRFSAGAIGVGTEDGGKAPVLNAQGRLDTTFLRMATTQDMDTGLSLTTLVSPGLFAARVAVMISEALIAAISAGPQSAGPADEGKAPVLNALGILDESYFSKVPSLYVGMMNPTVAGGGLVPPIINGSTGHSAGNYTVVGQAGRYDLATGTPSPAGILMSPLDVLYFNGAIWERVPNPMDVAEFIRRDGSVAMTGDLRFEGGTRRARSGARALPDNEILNARISSGTF